MSLTACGLIPELGSDSGKETSELRCYSATCCAAHYGNQYVYANGQCFIPQSGQGIVQGKALRWIDETTTAPSTQAYLASHPALKAIAFDANQAKANAQSLAAEQLSDRDYVTRLGSDVVLPLLNQQKQGLEETLRYVKALGSGAFERQATGDGLSQSEQSLLRIAAQYTGLYFNLTHPERGIDHHVEEFEDMGFNVDAEFEKCSEYSERYSGQRLVAGDPYRALLDRCMGYSQQIVDRLNQINETHPELLVIDLSEANAIHQTVGFYSSYLEQGIDPLATETLSALQRIKETSEMAHMLYTEQLQALISASQLYPMVRYDVWIDSELAPERNGPDNTPIRAFHGSLGEYAQVAVFSLLNSEDVPKEIRAQRLGRLAQSFGLPESDIASFASAVDAGLTTKQALTIFVEALIETLNANVTNNEQAQATIQAMMASNSSIENAWQIALAAETLELMSFYGGYDDFGQPLGLQAAHDRLLAQANALREDSGWTLVASGACFVLSLAGALHPVIRILGLGACGIATVAGGIDALALAEFAKAAHTLAFMGSDYAMFPPKEAIEVSDHSGIMSAVAVYDVMFSVVDVLDLQHAVTELLTPDAALSHAASAIDEITPHTDPPHLDEFEPMEYLRQVLGMRGPEVGFVGSNSQIVYVLKRCQEELAQLKQLGTLDELSAGEIIEKYFQYHGSRGNLTDQQWLDLIQQAPNKLEILDEWLISRAFTAMPNLDSAEAFFDNLFGDHLRQLVHSVLHPEESRRWLEILYQTTEDVFAISEQLVGLRSTEQLEEFYAFASNLIIMHTDIYAQVASEDVRFAQTLDTMVDELIDFLRNNNPPNGLDFELFSQSYLERIDSFLDPLFEVDPADLRRGQSGDPRLILVTFIENFAKEQADEIEFVGRTADEVLEEYMQYMAAFVAFMSEDNARLWIAAMEDIFDDAWLDVLSVGSTRLANRIQEFQSIALEIVPEHDWLDRLRGSLPSTPSNDHVDTFVEITSDQIQRLRDLPGQIN
ncbi:MAG: hypothetical protein IPJ88_01840 [Myxococcales bacterium]|nr:MAG: hypothetical protein IPJ88_01840 [Myxococcales bacterium]